jgi:hypothetical protein
MNKNSIYALTLASSLFAYGSAFAATMSTEARISIGSTDYTSSDSRLTGTSQSSRTHTNGNPEYYSRSLSDETGRTAAAAKIDYSYSYPSGGSNFDGEPHTNMATANWSNTFTGTGSNQILSFNIDQGWLEKSSIYGEETTRAGYGINILLNGTSIWSSHDEIGEGPYIPCPSEPCTTSTLYFNDYNDNQLAYTNLAHEDDPSIPTESYARAYDPFTGKIDLGAIGAGESFEISYVMSVYVSSEYFIGDDYVMAHFGDPLDLSGGMSVNVSASAVPIPAAAYLFGSGLIGLLGFKRKQSV